MTASHANLHEPASMMSLGEYDDEADDMVTGRSGSDEPDKPRWHVIPLLIALFVIGALAVVAWYAYHWSAGPVAGGEVPLVLAETTPAKVRPEDPGGLDVRHRDALILNQGTEGQVERLLPPPETPLPPPRIVQPAETAPPPATTPTVEVPQVEPAPKSVAPPATPPAATAPAPTAPAPAPQVAGLTKGFDLQLAALRSQDTAKQEAARLQRNLGSLLGEHSIQVLDPRPGGTAPVYRLRIGPFADRASAQGLCTQLKTKKQDCFVVKR
jgi:cell division septation protein DedD